MRTVGWPRMARLTSLVGAAALAACGSDPRYVQGPMGVEYDPALQGGDPAPPLPTVTLALPFALERDEDAAARAALAAELGVEVPYVVVDDLDVSVEWTLKNLEDQPGQARVHLNGSNPFFTYVPALLTIDPDEPDAITPPPLLGDIPIDVAASGTVDGVFREDELREASIDLELITRGNLNPFAAILINHEDLESYQPLSPIDPDDPEAPQTPVGPPLPIEAFAQMVSVDLSLEADRHMVLEFAVRVRDRRGEILHELLDSAPAGELTAYAPVVYDPLGAAAP
ncbi:MAG: hypothetical protein R2939_13275 [Kofleriaceae bacterium]